MFRSLFFRRLYLPYVLLICAVAIVVALVGALWLQQAFIEQRHQDLRNTVALIAEVLREPLVAGDRAALQQRVRDVGKTLDCRITLIAADQRGTVLADNEAEAAAMEPHGFRREIVQARANGEGWDSRTSGTLHVALLYHARRVDIPGLGPLFVRVAVHTRAIQAGLRTFYLGIALAAGAAIVGAMVLSYYLARRQAMPIVEVTHFADAVANGQLNHRILRTGPGELGILARSLNSMADSFSRLLSDAEKDKAELRTILTSMSEGVIATDMQRHILLANEAAGRLLCFPAEHAEGRLLWEVVRNEQIIKSLDEVAATAQRRQLQFGPLEGRYLEVTLCPLHHSSGLAGEAHSLKGFIVVLHDITQAFRYQELRKEFVANVSHELRTPLTVIKGFIETLRDGAINDIERRDRYLATIQRHADQLTNLVNDLLELSKLESHAALPGRTNVDLSQIVRRVSESMQPAATRRNQSLTLNLPSAPPPVVGNVDYIERAVTNLLDNAIKYTPDGGKISLTVRFEPTNAVVEVVDNGLGIPAEDIPRIFERFYRVDRSRSREMGGTGLGLSIVKHLINAHGGQVEVQSQPSAGSTFRIRLPLGD